MEKYNIEKDIAAYIKKEFDKKYNPTWHAIVGRNFGSYVTHETKHFIYFYLGQVGYIYLSINFAQIELRMYCIDTEALVFMFKAICSYLKSLTYNVLLTPWFTPA